MIGWTEADLFQAAVIVAVALAVWLVWGGRQ
jgi:hypothetical protein